MKDKRIPELKKEISLIYGAIRENPDAKEVGAKLISVLKSDVEGRGAVDEQRLAKLRRAFDVMTED